MKCTFCSKKLDEGTGKIFVQKSGKILYFCSNKCEKNMLTLKRDSKKLKWAKVKKNE
jgi:large subunit ribosomal protein L24e